jgi:HSP20 family protein
MRRMMEDFDRAWGDFGGQSRNRGGLWAPAIEVSQREGQLTVCAELPGLAKEDVKIEVTDDALIIEGERKQESSSDEGGFRRSERSYGRFYRSIPLPDGAKAEEAKANFSNGVLEVKMPVSEPQSNRRRITVEGS